MGTFKQFKNMDMVESCVPEKKFSMVADHCATCWISNCVKSLAFKAEMDFWHRYHEQQEINDLLTARSAQRSVRAKKRKGFRYVK